MSFKHQGSVRLERPVRLRTKQKEEDELNDLLACPFCGEPPEISSSGSCIDIYCCCSMSIQKSDELTLAERETYNCQTYKYSDEAELKAMLVAIERWNRRAI